jgi:drug/metabolite transporter (DMT)-like permease
MLYLWIFISVLLGTLGQVFMKERMKAMGPFPAAPALDQVVVYFWNTAWSWQMFGAAASYGVSFLIWLGVLSRADLTLARPLMSISYLLVLFYGYWVGERVSLERVFGVALITLGVFFVARSAASG